MRLKKISISGFKSFADKTTLHFDKGVTCIVGPNGCGKSNISDAFRWVLGEQSAKSMRGSKMPDVIFAGTSQRKPLNLAEVSLTLTDIQGSLPVDYEEITLTRRLHRSGESDYLINGNLVRLKDMHSLFLDSGIGRNAFSIFEQGKIDQVINYNPVERRSVFEEAAGILRFLQRKREALKRLEQADQNLSRVKDIHQEVEKRLIVLEKQAEKAKIFKESQALLEQLEKACYVLRWNQLEKKWLETEKRQQQQQRQLIESNENLSVLQGQNQETKQIVQGQEKTLRARNEELYQARSEKEIYTREQASNQDYVKEAQLKHKKLKRELEELTANQRIRQEAIQDIKQKQNGIEIRLKEAEGHLNSHQGEVKVKELELERLRNELQAKQQTKLACLQTDNRHESEWKQNGVRLENNLQRKSQLEARMNKLKEELSQVVGAAQEKKQQLNRLCASIDAYKERLDDYEDKLNDNHKEIEKKQKEIDESRRTVFECRARRQMLLKMREEHEGFSSGAKTLLKEAQTVHSPFYHKIRPLYEFLNPNPEAIEALTVILRAYSQTLVVETLEDFNRILSFAQQKSIQDYSLICLEWLDQSKATSAFIEEAGSNQASCHLLGGIHRTATNEEALKLLSNPLYRQPIWSDEKAYFDSYRVFFSPSPHENHVFLREAELKSLEEELNEKEDCLQAEEKEFKRLQELKSQWRLERMEVDKMLRRDEMKLVEVNVGLQRSLADQEKLKNEQETVQKEDSQAHDQIVQQTFFLERLERQYQEAKTALSQISQVVDFLQKQVDSHHQSLQVQQKNQKEKDNDYQQIAEERRQLAHQFHLLTAKEQDHDKQAQRVKEELANAEGLQAKMEEKNLQLRRQLQAAEIRLQEAFKVCLELEKETEANKETINRLDQEISVRLAHIRKMEEENNALSVQLAQQRSAAQSVEEELQARYQLSLQETRQLMPSAVQSLDQTERRIRGLRQSLQEAGDVNLTSIEELEKHQVRFQFLNQQMSDMAGSKDELLQIIAQLDTQSRKIFRETFELIRANFKKNFEILFSGGEADLQFTETDNILEAGIEIIARPPGKQMRSITLLSGGEKCLTAVALLFAIFEVKPSPFCILDEIDAPLDDANVERFVNVVKHFVDRCQFLIITHNKRTMAIGNVLFGISMQERGVSKALALEFSHETSPEALLV